MTNTDKARSVAPDVEYEFRMFEHAWNRFQENTVPGLDNNLCQECFLLHVRVLRDFFIGTRSHPDDVLAEDFFPDPAQWRNVARKLFAFVKKQRNDLNSTLAHLSYKRSTPKQWDHPQIHRETRAAIDLFLSELPSDVRGWFAR